MGSRLDVNQVANRLGKSVKTVYRMVKAGKLMAISDRGRLTFDSDELEEHLRGDTRRLPYQRLLDLERVVGDLHGKLAAAEHRMELLSYINGIDVTQLRDVTDEQLLALREEATKARMSIQRVTHLNRTVVQQWGEFFLQVTELEVHRLVGLTTRPRPWSPFYLLCLEMQHRIRTEEGFEASMGLQGLYRLLERGRKVLGEAIILTDEILAAETGTTATRRLLGRDTVRDAVLRLIEADPAKY